MAYHPLKSILFAFFLIARDIHCFFYCVDLLFFPLFIFFYAYIYILSDGDVRHNIIVFPKLLFLHFNETSLHIYIFFLIAKQI